MDSHYRPRPRSSSPSADCRLSLRAEGRYRAFADFARRCGRVPRAYDHRIGAEVMVWCSNDYFGGGKPPGVLAAMEETNDVGASNLALTSPKPRFRFSP